jgi:hypothetical protein
VSGAGTRRYWIPLAATLMSLVALGPLPYGYYMLLRVSLCVVCAYYLLQSSPPLSSGHRIALGGLAVLYNPVLPVHLGSKPLWSLVNLGTVIYLWVLARYHSRGKMAPPNPPLEPTIAEERFHLS